MAVYTVRFKDEVVLHLESDAPRVRIGRAEECELHIDNLGVSRYHAVIEAQGGIRVLRDLGSHNGVYYNGKMVKSRVLNDGDVFVIGKYRLEYSDGTRRPAEATLAPPATPAPAANDIGMKTFAIEPSALAHLQQAERVKGYLRRDDGRIFDLRATIVTFGRDVRCDVPVKGWFLPRIVAVVVRDERGFLVLNVSGSPGRVRVQGRSISMYVRLENAFELTIGRDRFTFHSGRPAGAD